MSAQFVEELGGVCSVCRGARRCLLSLERSKDVPAQSGEELGGVCSV